MPAITTTDLNNAKLDVDHIAAIATSTSDTSTDRLGHTKNTIYHATALINADVTAVDTSRITAQSDINADVAEIEARKTLALTVDIPAAIATVAAINNRDAWVTATAYTYKDIVSESGTWYMCVVPHTSGATFAGDSASKWRIYQGVTSGDLSAQSGAGMVGLPLEGTVLNALTGSNKGFVGAGDSNMQGVFGGSTTPFLDYFQQECVAFNQAVFVNTGVAGRKISDIVTSYATEVFPHRPSASGRSEVILAVLILTNDIDSGSGTDPDALFSALSSYWSTAKADGFKLMAFCVPQQGGATYEKNWLVSLVNRRIRNSNIWDYLIDIELMLGYPDAANPYFGDNLHPNDLGKRRIAKGMVSAIASGPDRLPSSDNIIDFLPALPSGSESILNGAALNILASTTSSFSTPLTALGTGDFTIMTAVALPAGHTGTTWVLKGSTNKGFGVNGKRMLAWGDSLQFSSALLKLDILNILAWVRKAGVIKFYLNGNLIGSIADASNYPEMIGIASEGASQIARLRVMTRALSESEIRRSYLDTLAFRRNETANLYAMADGNVAMSRRVPDLVGGRDLLNLDQTKAILNQPAKIAAVSFTTSGTGYNDLTKVVPTGRVISYVVNVTTSGGGAIVIGDTDGGDEYSASSVLPTGKKILTSALANSGFVFVRGSPSGYVISHEIVIVSY